MSDPFVAEIRIFPFNFAPKGWALCAGQLMSISQNTALFSLLGTMYGGDGRVTFGLPNLQGRVPMHTTQFSSSPFGDFPIGAEVGEPYVTLLISEMPAHPHGFQGIASAAQTPGPQGAGYATPNWVSGTTRGVAQAYSATASNLTTMNPQAVSLAGGGQPHNNMMPYQTLSYCIALQGIFPPRS